MSEGYRTWLIRWGAIFQPWCWIRGHDWTPDYDAHEWNPGQQLCFRCGVTRDASP